ncbi:MAG TPA: hypothetical protein VGX16_02245, partial [Solirubrobacteraceae bacterium]|nr:hypothetical protein [Solirubrobacteraceae bacterium]
MGTPIPVLAAALVFGGVLGHSTQAGTRALGPLGAPLTRPATQVDPNAPIPVANSNLPYPGRRLSADGVIATAGALAEVRAVEAKNRGSYGAAYLKGPGRWQVSWFSRGGRELAQVYVSDETGRVLEAWTGFQVAWTMARGYPGAFGRHVNALYV